MHEALYQYYTCDIEKYANMTLRELYPKWKAHKEKISTSETNVVRIHSDWKKHYLNADIIDIPITKLKKVELEEWVHAIVKENHMTRTQYANFSLIIRQMLNYAIDLNILEINYFNDIKIDSKLFRRVKKKNSQTQVYTIDEQQQLIALAIQDFKSNTRRKTYPLTPLAILFQFQTGLRVGELCALRYEDIVEGNCIHIQRMYQKDTKKIVEHTKTNDSDRYIDLTKKAKSLIEMAQQYQMETNADHTGYIFSINSLPLSPHAVNDALRKYCKQLGIEPKSSHKVRKTVLSALIDAGININAVRELAGHASETTTYRHYCYDRRPSTEKLRKMEQALA